MMIKYDLFGGKGYIGFYIPGSNINEYMTIIDYGVLFDIQKNWAEESVWL